MHQELLENFDAEEPYDIITGLQMLNHYGDPTSVLLKLKSLLKPDGLLFTETLDFTHALSRKPLKACVHVDHPFMFTRRSLRDFFTKTGFKVQTIEADSERSFDFTSKNHVHALCRIDTSESCFQPSATAALNSKLECLTSMAQFFSHHIDQVTDNRRHFAERRNPIQSLVRRIHRIFRTK